jgi:hypothetical protein
MFFSPPNPGGPGVRCARFERMCDSQLDYTCP